MQAKMIEWDVRYFYKTRIINPSALMDFLMLALRMTSWLLPIGLAIGLLKKKTKVRTVAMLELAFMGYVSIQVFLGGSLPEPKYLIYLFPLTSMLLASILGGVKLKGSYAKKVIFAAFLLTVIMLPLGDHWIFPVKTYIGKPAMEAGLALAALYNGGGVISDSPTVIYYSRIEPTKFYPSESIYWYASGWSKEKLKEWYLKNDVHYIVWQNVSHSGLWWLFPELSSGKDRVDLTDQGVSIAYLAEYTKVYYYRDRTVRIHIYRISLIAAKQ